MDSILRVDYPRLKVANIKSLIRLPVFWALVVSLSFIAILVWWILVDAKTHDPESSRHFYFALTYLGALDAGNPLTLFYGLSPPIDDLYPPVHGIVGVIGFSLFGKSFDSMLFAQLLVYFPILIVGLYGAGVFCWGRIGGILAVLFAVATPVVIQFFHAYLVDISVLALTAISVWLLLRTNRYKMVGGAAFAGLAVGVGMLTKPNFLFVWPGLMAVMLLRGGWRNWRGILVFSVVSIAIAAPWYLYHFEELRAHPGATSAVEGVTISSIKQVPQFSGEHFSYMGWELVNVDLFIPLALLIVVGTIYSSVRFVRNRRSDDYTPELLGGLVIFFIGMSILKIVDWRVLAPSIVYFALIVAGMMTSLQRLHRFAAIGVLCLIAVVNTVMLNTGVGERVTLSNGKWSTTIIADHSVVVREPNTELKMESIFKRLKEKGITKYWAPLPLHPSQLNIVGLNVTATLAGVALTADTDLSRNTVVVVAVNRPVYGHSACTRVAPDSTDSIYLVRGPVTATRVEQFVKTGQSRGLDIICPI